VTAAARPVGVPEMRPVRGSKERPAGRGALMLQETAAPAVRVGAMGAMAMPLVRTYAAGV